MDRIDEALAADATACSAAMLYRKSEEKTSATPTQSGR